MTSIQRVQLNRKIDAIKVRLDKISACRPWYKQLFKEIDRAIKSDNLCVGLFGGNSTLARERVGKLITHLDHHLHELENIWSKLEELQDLTRNFDAFKSSIKPASDSSSDGDTPNSPTFLNVNNVLLSENHVPETDMSDDSIAPLQSG